jgi:hypothetical protein
VASSGHGGGLGWGSIEERQAGPSP